MKLKIYSKDGSACREDNAIQIPNFEGDRGKQALRQVVLAYRSNMRQGNACAKTRSEVSGTGKKPYRQKGTGMARHGSKRSPIWVKGGVVFGPRPRDYRQKINKKMRLLAFARALFDSVESGRVSVIDGFEMSSIKTAVFKKVIDQICPSGKVLLIDEGFNLNVILSGRNLVRCHFREVDELNAYDLIEFDNLIISRLAFSSVLSRLEGKVYGFEKSY